MLDYLFSFHPILLISYIAGLVAAITVHEFAHAFVADKLGDPTPRMQGRVTLNPLAHLDPLGTLALFLTRFGWGRPVEFDPYNLQNPVRDSALIALAGPASNLILATLITLVIRFTPIPETLMYALLPAVILNVVLACFNLVPIHPLDGSKIILALLPRVTAYEYEQIMHRYGVIILVLMIVPWNGQSMISQLIGPLINLILTLLGSPLL
jgi:Zn-dependent protease